MKEAAPKRRREGGVLALRRHRLTWCVVAGSGMFLD